MKTRAKNRIWELDFLRGFAILMVLVDHGMFNFFSVFDGWGVSGNSFLEFLNSTGLAYVNSDIRVFWRPAFLFLFFCTSGLCTAFSRNNFLRGIKLAFVAMLLSLVTYIADKTFIPDSFVMFGVLHCMAAIILIYSLVAFIVEMSVKIGFKLARRQFDDRVYKYVLSGICLVLAIGFFFINKKYNVGFIDATGYFQTVDTGSKFLGLFFYADNWWTSDYFPLFPFISFFFFGAFLAPLLYPKKKSLLPCLDGVWHTPFTFPGRHSLAVYLFGQLIILAICAALDAILL